MLTNFKQAKYCDLFHAMEMVTGTMKKLVPGTKVDFLFQVILLIDELDKEQVCYSSRYGL